MVNCSLVNCKNRSIKGGEIRFFSFPRDETVAQTWLQYCRPKTTKKTGRVCSVHFLSSDYHKSLRHILMNESPKKCRQLKPDAIPSLHLPYNTIAQPSQAEPLPKTKSSDTVTNYTQPDLPTTDCKELSNTSGTSCCVQNQTTQIKTHCTETQTTEICSNTVTILASDYYDLMAIKNEYQVIEEKLQQIFTPGQLCRLIESDNYNRCIQWSAEDIAAATITFRSIGAKGYRYLRNVVGIPLPGSSTLYKWAPKIEIVDPSGARFIHPNTVE